jgi:hypothetical protein
MTPAEEGAYIRLLGYDWMNDGLPDNDEQLAALSRLGEGWFKGSGTRLRECFPLRDGKLHNPPRLATDGPEPVVCQRPE